MKVSKLLCPITNEWDLVRIRALLPQYEGDIRSIITSYSPLDDSVIWLPEKSGQYKTRSGYGLGITSRLLPDHNEFTWLKNIWNLRTCPKIKDFLWKIAKKTIPVSSNLASRGLPSFKCKKCRGVEDDLHALLSCPFAASVWLSAPITPCSFADPESIQALLCNLLLTRNLPPIGLSIPLWQWILWALWKARNLLCFENRSTDANSVLLRAITAAKEWQEANNKSPASSAHLTPTRASSSSVITLPLCADTVHVHVDAAWNSSSNVCGIGGTFSFMDRGSFPDISLSRSFVTSALIAEALAIRTAVMTASTANTGSLIVLSDSLTLVSLLKTKESRGELVGMLSDILYFGLSFDFLDLVYVPRLCNVAADLLAKSALAAASTSLVGV